MKALINEADLRAENDTRIDSWREFMDLAVPLTIELGRTKMIARALLELEVNSIIQLSRSTGEGVDVIADTQRMARGEIIMIEDRTGVRINEIIIPEI